MSGLALVLPWNAVFLFRSPLRDTSFAYRNRPTKFVANATLPKPSLNAPRQQTASDEIPIASDARPLHTSRGFLPWRFAHAGPRRAPRRHHGAAIRKPSQTQKSAGLSRMSVPTSRADVAGSPRHVRLVPKPDVLARLFLDRKWRATADEDGHYSLAIPL